MKPIVGFVGLGNIGEPICRHVLARGYAVRIYDVDQRALARLGDTQGQIASSPAELAAAADVVILSLPNSAVVERVVFGERGLAEGFSAGKVLIDTSSSKPSSTRRIAETLAARGVQMLDAPVSGGVPRAREGTLAIMVGGERPVFDRYRELLGAFGDQIFYIGEHGSGHLAKAINNLISATTLASAVEAVLLGVRAGLDPQTLIEVVNASSGRSNSTEVKFPRYILNRRFDAGFAVALMNKDVKIALDAAAEIEFPMPIGAAAGQLWQLAVTQGYGAADHTAIYRFFEQLTAEGEHRRQGPDDRSP